MASSIENQKNSASLVMLAKALVINCVKHKEFVADKDFMSEDIYNEMLDIFNMSDDFYKKHVSGIVVMKRDIDAICAKTDVCKGSGNKKEQIADACKKLLAFSVAVAKSIDTIMYMIEQALKTEKAMKSNEKHKALTTMHLKMLKIIEFYNEKSSE